LCRIQIISHRLRIVRIARNPGPERRSNQKRLIAILKTFSAIQGPKQLYKHEVLRLIYSSLVGHPDLSVAHLAFTNLRRFGDSGIRAYADILEKLFVNGKLRDALLQIKMAADSDSFALEHRAALIPTLCRILFGRLASKAGAKSSKDSPAARRGAILSFLNGFCEEDGHLYPFMYLMLRGYISQDHGMDPVELHVEVARRNQTLDQARRVSLHHVMMTPATMHEGFLNLLESVIDQLGHRVTFYVPAFASIVVAIAQVYQSSASTSLTVTRDESADDAGGNEAPGKSSIRRGAIRALCFRRLSNILTRFHSSIDFSAIANDLWLSIQESIGTLPEMASNSKNIPALLLCVASLSTQTVYVPFLELHNEVVVSVFRCISGTACAPVIDRVLKFIENLLGSTDDDTGTAPHLVQKNVGVLLSQFQARLESSNLPGDAKGTAFKAHSVHQSWKQELRILSRVSSLLGSDLLGEPMYNAADSLCRVLFPYLERRRFAESERLHVLDILRSIAKYANVESAPEYYARLSKMLGLNGKALPVVVSNEVRGAIASVLESFASTAYPDASQCSKLVLNLCAVNSKRVDELDYDKVLEALGMLSESEHWIRLSTPSAPESEEPRLLLPVVCTCFALVFETDGVVARSAVGALKALATASARKCGLHDTPCDSSDAKWHGFFQGSVISSAREGLRSRDEGLRRFFVQIMREISINCRSAPSPHFYGDLFELVRLDDHDLDFFLNMTHVQIHRRARALQRLRKSLNEGCTFSLHSISNVLLPLVLHPVYESKTKSDEPLALESIATAGVLARFLSFSKYNTLLMTTLSQLNRNQDQERYLVALLCAVVDAFPFDARGCQPSDETNGAHETTVVRSVELRIIPRVESLLIKEQVDRRGTRTKTLRPSVALALLKICQKLPESTFRAKLPRLLTSVCAVLKSRESDARDVARVALAKMTASMDLMYIPDVVRELALSLNDGYRLHVRAAAIHSILLELESHPAFLVREASSEQSRVVFGRAVPGLLDLLQQDLFGNAQETKDAEGIKAKFVKEAHGSKTFHSLELIASLIQFSPRSSTINSLVAPFLERLRRGDVRSTEIRKIRECLTRIVAGFIKNPTTRLVHVVGVVVASISPFIQNTELHRDPDWSMVDEFEDDGEQTPICVSGGRPPKRSRTTEPASSSKPSVSEWRPSTLNAPRDEESAKKMKVRAEKSLSKVLDGRNAPKLTGSGRSTASVAGRTIDNPANVTAVVFGLQLMNASVKNAKETVAEDITSKLDHMFSLLIACVSSAKDLDVVVLSLRCLDQLFRFDLPSLPACAQRLGERCIGLLTAPGAASKQQQELFQTSLKVLSSLLDKERHRLRGEFADESAPSILTDEQTRITLTILRSAILESEQPTTAMKLINSIVATKFLSPELYDLMETLLEQSVRSTRPALRQQCSATFVSYLLNYPLSVERTEEHLKQVILNLQFEYPDGRLASLALLATIIEKVPFPFLEQHSRQIFLSLTLVVVNDASEDCRQIAARNLSALLHRLPYEHQGALCDIVVRWTQGEDDSLRRTGLQLCGIVVRACPDTLNRRHLISGIVDVLEATLKRDRPTAWETLYFSLMAMEKAVEAPIFLPMFDARHDLWTGVIRCLRNDHPWVRLVALRLLSRHVSSLGLRSDADDLPHAKASFFVQRPGSLFETARGLCLQLGLEEADIDEEAAHLTIKALSLVLPTIDRFPSLCFAEPKPDEVPETRDPVVWIFTRLSSIAKQKGSRRRRGVFKCFAALAESGMDVVKKHLELLLEPIHRCVVESENELDSEPLFSNSKSRGSSAHQLALGEDAQLAKSVLHILEEKCSDSPEVFLRAYAAVQSRAKSKKEQRKLAIKAEAVRDPQASAERRGRKQDREKSRRKRRINDGRRSRGLERVGD
jgi:U3 small nucleolar RNA-associated protein 20